MSRVMMLILILVMVYISALRFDLLVESLISLCLYFVLTITGMTSPSTYWNAGLLEFWVAVLTWLAGSIWLVRKIPGTVRKKTNRSDASTARWLPPVLTLAIVAFVACTSPVLAPVDPHAQGDLTNTRLLPPLSLGTMKSLAIPAALHSGNTAWLERRYTAANNFLLHKLTTIEGGIGSPADGPSAESKEDSGFIFFMGTDDTGRDVFSRVISGTRVSLGIGLLAALGALFIGGAIGFTSGMAGGALDGTLMRLTDLFLSIPSVLLVIGCVAFLGQSMITLILVLALTGWMSTARIIRGEVVTLREREFVLAARMLGVSTPRIIFRHLLPNLRPVLVAAGVLQFGSAVLSEATLSFLGLGIQPPTPSWGNMMGEAMGYLGSAWWVGFFPGLLLTLVILSAHSAVERTTMQ